MNFTPFPKIPRLYKDVVITEKIDGTNAAIRIVWAPNGVDPPGGLATSGGNIIYAQSRNRNIPLSQRKLDDRDWEKEDNAGFGAWVREHAECLVEVLGPGVHFGEWWGWKIQRGYGLEKGDRRFSLFNTARWGHFASPETAPDVPGLGVVPVLYEGEFSEREVLQTQRFLQWDGSRAAPGYQDPEGIVIYHTAADKLFKVPFAKKVKAVAA